MSDVFGIVFFCAMALAGASVFNIQDPSLSRMGASFILMVVGLIGVATFTWNAVRGEEDEYF